MSTLLEKQIQVNRILTLNSKRRKYFSEIRIRAKESHQSVVHMQ